MLLLSRQVRLFALSRFGLMFIISGDIVASIVATQIMSTGEPHGSFWALWSAPARRLVCEPSWAALQPFRTLNASAVRRQ